MKLKCAECGWKGLYSEILKAGNPFDVTGEIWGCPKCKDVETLHRACDEPDCWEDYSCGTPTENGYRTTCYKHKPD